MHKVVTVEDTSVAQAAAKAQQAINDLAQEGWQFLHATCVYLQRRKPLDSQDWQAQDSIAYTLFFSKEAA